MARYVDLWVVLVVLMKSNQSMMLRQHPPYNSIPTQSLLTRCVCLRLLTQWYDGQIDAIEGTKFWVSSQGHGCMYYVYTHTYIHKHIHAHVAEMHSLCIRCLNIISRMFESRIGTLNLSVYNSYIEWEKTSTTTHFLLLLPSGE